MIRLSMLPGDDGDCVLLEYGEDASPRRILIDGGRADTYPQIRPTLQECGGHIDVLVVTHIDQDHILGAVALLEDPDRPVGFGDVWFNGYGHLLEVEDFGPKDGERLTAAVVDQGFPWNRAFSGRSVEVGRPVDLGDGSSLTILSPDRAQLAALAPQWLAECRRHGLLPHQAPEPVVPGFESFGPLNVDVSAEKAFVPDRSKANRSSIGFAFEFEGKRLVFTGDADDGRIARSLRDHAAHERLHVDVLKVSHHGSEHNLSKDLLAAIACDRYLISTSGARHHHPNDAAMSRILKYGGDSKEIVFNYREPAARWDVGALKERYGYTTTAPPANQDGFVTLEL